MVAPAPRSSRPTPSRPRGSSSRSGASASTPSRSTRRPPRSPARPSARTASSRARSARPATCPPPTTRRSATITFRELVEVFTEQAQGLVRGGADLHDHRDRAGHPRGQGRDLRRARGVQAGGPQRADPDLASRCCPTAARCCWAPTSPRCSTTLEALKVDVIGLNCSTGPDDMRDAIRFLGEHSLDARSTASRTPACPSRAATARRSSPRAPTSWPTVLGEFVEQLRRLDRRRLLRHDRRPHPRDRRARRAAHKPGARPAPRPPQVSSMIAATPLVQEPAPTLVGERVNSQGSRKAKELLLADDYDGLVQIAEDQVEGGAHVLDLCVALTERADEDEQMRMVAKRVSLTQPAPLQIDSTEPDVIKLALEQTPGRAIVNSINLEAGRDKADTVIPLAIAARRGADRADHRRGRHGQDGRAQGRDRQAHQGDRLRRARPRSRAADLRRADVHADHRRRRVEAVGGRDDQGHPRRQGGAAGRQDVARRLQRLLRRRPARPRGAELRLPAPLRRGRAGPRDGQPQSHHAVRGDHRAGARARRRPGVQPPRGRAAALHRALRVRAASEAEAEVADPTAGMEPEEALHWHILRRKKDGVEAQIDAAVEKLGAVPCSTTCCCRR